MLLNSDPLKNFWMGCECSGWLEKYITEFNCLPGIISLKKRFFPRKVFSNPLCESGSLQNV